MFEFGHRGYEQDYREFLYKDPWEEFGQVAARP